MGMTTAEREELARKRLQSVLARHGIANARTLEQKISDAGPKNQRIDPHVLTRVRRTLVDEGRIKRTKENNAFWYYLPNTPRATVEKRLEEQLPIFQALQHGIYEKFRVRMGQCLEIAIYRALLLQDTLHYAGSFTDLEEHDDSRPYSKEEPPQSFDGKHLPGDQKLDFLIIHREAGLVGIEAKNIREWLYPDREEITELLGKAVALDCVPVLIARRFPFVTFKLLSACGVVLHENYNQLLPKAERELAEKVKNKRLLGYHDIRLGNQPNDRLIRFVTTNLPRLLPRARERFDEYKDLLEAFASGMSYEAFAARVRRRLDGVDEERDWWESPPDEHG